MIKKLWGMIPARYTLCFLAFWGFAFNYLLRVNMNFTIVAMVDYKAVVNQSVVQYYHDEEKIVDECPPITVPKNKTGDRFSLHRRGEFRWNAVVQSQVIGSFYWGYSVVQFLIGLQCDKKGGKWVVFAGMLVAAILTILIPWSARLTGKSGIPYVLYVIRALIGLAEGVYFPATKALLSKWVPKKEKTILPTLVFIGSQFGTVLAYPSAAGISVWLGWENVFYVMGGSCFVWLALWLLFVHNSPEIHPRISENERVLLEPEQAITKVPIRWKTLFRSMPFWAIFAANIANNWFYHLLMAELPTYFKTVLQMNLSENMISCLIPYICMLIFAILVSLVSHYLLKHDIVAIVTARKTANTIAHVGPALCLLSLSFVDCGYDSTIPVILLTAAITLNGALYGGFMTNVFDISPNYAATIFGLTNAVGSLNGWIAPLVAGELTKGRSSVRKWKAIWYMTFGILIVEALFYLAFASGVVQHWNAQPVGDYEGSAHIRNAEKEEEEKEPESPTTVFVE